MSNKRILIPSLTDSGLETQIISEANRLVLKQIETGQASSQLLTQIRKQNSPREKLEIENLRLRNELLEARIETERLSQQNMVQFDQVMAALQSYTVSFGKTIDD